MTRVTVDIADVYSNVIKPKAKDVRVGDYVFSTTGKLDRVIRVSSLRNNSKRVTITPATLWPLVIAPDEYVTVNGKERDHDTH
jgi:hypothetical protein